MNEKALTQALILYWRNAYVARSHGLVTRQAKPAICQELSILLGWKHHGWLADELLVKAGWCSEALNIMRDELSHISEKAQDSREGSAGYLERAQEIFSEMKEINELMEAASG